MTRLTGAALIGLFLATALLSAQDYPHAYPRESAEQLFENHRVTVWEVVWHDDVPQPYHQHRYDMTGVFLAWAPLRVTRLDGTFTDSEVPFELSNVLLLQKGVTHKEESTGAPDRHAIMIDMKDTSDVQTDTRANIPPAFPRDGAEAALDSARVTVWDVTWRPPDTRCRFTSTQPTPSLSSSTATPSRWCARTAPRTPAPMARKKSRSSPRVRHTRSVS